MGAIINMSSRNNHRVIHASGGDYIRYDFNIYLRCLDRLLIKRCLLVKAGLRLFDKDLTGFSKKIDALHSKSRLAEVTRDNGLAEICRKLSPGRRRYLIH